MVLGGAATRAKSDCEQSPRLGKISKERERERERESRRSSAESRREYTGACSKHHAVDAGDVGQNQGYVAGSPALRARLHLNDIPLAAACVLDLPSVGAKVSFNEERLGRCRV